MDLTDFFPRPKNTEVLKKCKQTNTRELIVEQDELKKWLVRRVECIRGEIDFGKLALSYKQCRSTSLKRH